MIVIKLGGSLLAANTLANCLNHIEKNYQHQKIVLVAGGGLFADNVRLAQTQWQFDDVIAHEMAILAMQQMALLFKGLKTNFALCASFDAIRENHNRQKIVIWSPDYHVLNAAKIPATWAITSDSLAAWLATQLHANQLIIVKSATINTLYSLEKLQKLGILDAEFLNFTSHAGYTIDIFQLETFLIR